MENWPDLHTLCHDYYNSVKTQSLVRRPMANSKEQIVDHEAHQKKVK
jgi:hypothetical protein